MPTLLTEGQWELLEPGAETGYVFGKRTPVRVLAEGRDLGAAENRVQDAERPHADGLLMGRDHLSAPEWSLMLGVKNEGRVWECLSELQAAWRPPSRTDTGALSTLRFCRAGVTYRALGRPRKFGVTPAALENHSVQRAVATFQLAAPEYHVETNTSGGGRSLELRLLPPTSTGGIEFPVELPLSWQADTSARMGEVTVGGFRPAPFTVQVYGPAVGAASKFKVSGDGWEVYTSRSLNYDQSFLIDTAANTIGRAGQSWAGSLSRASRLDARLQPGPQFITFEADDPSGSCRAVVRWFDTLPA